MHRFLLLLSVSFAVAVSGCGFRPRASLALADELGPVKVVTADPYSPLAYGLATALDRAGAEAAAAGADAATLHVRSERLETRPLSVDRRAQVREYESRYLVKFELRDAAGKVLVPFVFVFSPSLLLVASGFTLAGLVGHLLQLEHLYGITVTRMAIHTTVGLLIVCVGLWGYCRATPWYQQRHAAHPGGGCNCGRPAG